MGELKPNFDHIFKKRVIRESVIEVVEQVQSVLPDDLELSMSLRDFEVFSQDVRDAVWALFGQPDQAVVCAMDSFMRKRVVRRIIKGDASPIADLGIVVQEDVVALDSQLHQLPTRMSMFLAEAGGSVAVAQEVRLPIKTQGMAGLGLDKMVVNNSTLFSTPFLVQLLSAVVNADMRVRQQLPVDMINAMFSNEDDCYQQNVLDFLIGTVELIKSEAFIFDILPRGISEETLRVVSTIMATREPYERQCVRRGMEPTIHARRALNTFIEEAMEADKTVGITLFYFMYPQQSLQIYEQMRQSVQLLTYENYGSVTLSTWVSVVDAVLAPVTEPKISAIESYVDAMCDNADDTTFQKTLKAVEDTLCSLKGEVEELPDLGYGAHIKALRGSKLEQLRCRRKANLDKYRFPQQFMTLMEELVQMSVQATLLGESCRLIRTQYSKQDDKITNKMVKLFPGHYKQLFYDSVYRAEVVPDVIVVNCDSMLNKFRICNTSNGAKVLHVNLDAKFGEYEDYENVSGVFDLNDGYFDSSEDPFPVPYYKSWGSPVRAARLSERLLAIYAFARDNDAHVVMRIPMMMDLDSLMSLFAFVSLKTCFRLIPPASAHEPCFYMVVTDLSDLADSGERVERFLVWMRALVLNYAVGVMSRHRIWQSPDRDDNAWAMQRIIQLDTMGYKFQADYDLKRVITNVVVKVGNVKRHSTKKGRKNRMLLKQKMLSDAQRNFEDKNILLSMKKATVTSKMAGN